MSEKLYRLYCETCNWKLITNGEDETAKKLVEIKTSPIPGGIPSLDPETNKIIIPEPRKQIKKFKCPQCGRGVRPVKIKNVQEHAESKQEIKKRVENRNDKDWSVGREKSFEGQ